MISINWSTNLNFYKLSTKLFSLFSSVFTTPNGQVVNGNKNNTLFIYPIEAHDYGVYSVVYTDLKGCISNYTFEVIQVNPLGGGYYRNSVWTYGRFTSPSVGGRRRKQLYSLKEKKLIAVSEEKGIL